MDVIAKACPPPDTGRGWGPLAASYREAMTQMTMGGAGVSEANEVLRNHTHTHERLTLRVSLSCVVNQLFTGLRTNRKVYSCGTTRCS